MSDESTLDMVRWTFTANPEHRAELEAYLTDHGADVHIKNEAEFIVLWDEPEFDMDQVVEALWTTNGGEFQVTHEEFHLGDGAVFGVPSSLLIALTVAALGHAGA